MVPGNSQYSLLTGASRAVFFVPRQGWTVYHSQHSFTAAFLWPPPILPPVTASSLTFPLEQNSLKEFDTLVASNFSLCATYWLHFYATVTPITPLKPALSWSPVTTSLGPTIMCEPSTNLNHRKHLTQLIIPYFPETFFFLASRLPQHLIFFLTHVHLLPIFLPGYSSSSCLLHIRVLGCFLSLSTHYPGDVIQAHSFHYYPYANNSQMSQAQASGIKLQIWYLGSLFDISWISNSHLNLNKFKLKLLIFLSYLLLQFYLHE